MKEKEMNAYFISLPPQKKLAIMSRVRTYSAFKPADFVAPVRLFQNGVLQDNELLEREKLVEKICHFWAFGITPQKRLVATFISSKGMGKTTLLKFLADPSRIPELKPPELLRAGKCGRILCVYAPDFEHFGAKVWQMVIAQHCATIFDQCSVGGIEFAAANLETLSSPHTALTLSDSMKIWLIHLREAEIEDAFEELKHLTALAFGETEQGEVVALVDECQAWAKSVASNRKQLLCQAVSTVPQWVRIGVAGLADNQLEYLSDGGMSYICEDGELTTFSESAALHVAGQSPIAPIVVALTRVPRILCLGNDTAHQFPGMSLFGLLENWRYAVSNYYHADISSCSVEDASWIIAATTCRWIVPHFVRWAQELCVPGTKVPWRLLLSQSFISRNVEGQVSLIFGVVRGPQEWMTNLRTKFFELFGVTLEHAVFDYAQWLEAKTEGTTTLVSDSWEHLVNSALVLRYHLLSKQIETNEGKKPLALPLSTVYECDEKFYPGNVLSRFEVCLEKANYVENEVFVSTSLASGLYSNKAIASAHHDAILSCAKPLGLSLGIQYRFGAPKDAELLPQLQVSKVEGAADCVLLHFCPTVVESAFKKEHATLLEAHQASRFAELSGRGCMNEEVLHALLLLHDL